MIESFYLPRWKMFLDGLDRSLAEGEPFDVEAFEHEIRTWEEQWTHKSDPFPDQPEGDAVEVARRLWTKYHKEIL
jgi:alpha-N-acetylglucosaminidase